jgi:hypothetical protein
VSDLSFDPGKRFRVTEAFPSDFFEGLSQPPLILNPGDTVVVSDEKGSATWPAFVLVMKGDGERGWVPERYLRRNGRDAVAARRYDTTTLNPARDEILTVIESDVESGWLWCRDERGHVGWFAINRLTPES